MAITDNAKHYLDHAGLVQLISLIKANDAKVAADAQTALETLVGTVPAKVGETDTATVVAYINAMVAAANKAADDRLDVLEGLHAEGLDTTVLEEAEGAIAAIAAHSEDNGDTDLVKVTVTTTAGSVSAVAVDDSALDTEIAKLAATHAKNGDGSYQSVATEIAKVVDGSPEAFDTLKEIANWIDNNADADNQGFDAAARIVALENAVDKANLIVATADADTPTVQKAINKAVGDEETARKAQIGTIPAKVGDVDTTTVVAYVDAKVAEVNSAVENLDADITSEDDALVTVEVVQVGGEITGVVVTDLAAPCDAIDVDNIWFSTAAGTLPTALKEKA